MGSAQSTKAVDTAADRVPSSEVAEDDTTPEHSSSSTVEDCASLSESALSTPPGISEVSDVSSQAQLSVCGSPHPSRNSAILIFDLDDTLIPTEWIRSSFAAQKHKHATADEVYQSKCASAQAIKREFDRLTSNELTPHILSTLKGAKKWSETVVIVTNARSIRWLSAMKSLFPEVVQLLDDEDIPIIRSCPVGEEPSIHEAPAYFAYWMNAKKTKFLEVIRQHCKTKCPSPTAPVDLVSIGDNDFEEYAALRAAHELPTVRLAKVVRCRSGLEPRSFLHQLKDIALAIDCLFEEATPCATRRVGATVTYTIHGRRKTQ
ncbi:hypothetical protein Emag_003088 [Eimeria magna]